MAAPWFKFYPTDWQADQALRICSLAARAVWIECMCIMHRAQPYGHLVINGRPPTDAQLASLVGAPLDQLSALLAELESAGVFSRTRTGVIYSRRMTRDEKKRKDGAKAAEAQGSVPGSRRSQATDKRSENLPPPGVVSTPPPHPEARDQKPETKSKQRSKTELDALENQLRSAANLDTDPSPGLFDLSPILGLLDAGYSLDSDILPVIRARSGKTRARSWSFFVPAIKDARAKRLSIAAAPAPVEPQIDWDAAVKRFHDHGIWPGYLGGKASGPEPGYPGCRAPKDILTKYGYGEQAA